MENEKNEAMAEILKKLETSEEIVIKTYLNQYVVISINAAFDLLKRMEETELDNLDITYGVLKTYIG